MFKVCLATFSQDLVAFWQISTTFEVAPDAGPTSGKFEGEGGALSLNIHLASAYKYGSIAWVYYSYSTLQHIESIPGQYELTWN